MRTSRDGSGASSGNRVTERPAYFEGKVLTADDLRQEQEYHLDRQRAHNRLHGQGVVTGLEVRPTRPQSDAVVVAPGSAIDALGREIVLVSRVTVDLRTSVRGKRPRSADLVVVYGEEEVAPVPVGEETWMSRIRETPRFVVGAHGDDAGVVLARIRVPHVGEPITARMIDVSIRCPVSPGCR